MQFSLSFALAAFTGFVAAQTSTSAAGSASTAAAGSMINTHIIQVGSTNGSLGFFPNNVQAPAGDYVQFQFRAQNHSVTQASFNSPCTPIENNPSAFFSGFMPAQSQILTYTIRVPDSNPVYFYSSQGNDCQGGMVGSINAPTSGTGSLQSFSQAAAQAKQNVTPGQASSASTNSAPTTASSGPSSSSTSASPSSTAVGSAKPSPTGNAAASFSSQSFFGLSAALAAALALL